MSMASVTNIRYAKEFCNIKIPKRCNFCKIQKTKPGLLPDLLNSLLKRPVPFVEEDSWAGKQMLTTVMSMEVCQVQSCPKCVKQVHFRWNYVIVRVRPVWKQPPLAGFEAGDAQHSPCSEAGAWSYHFFQLWGTKILFLVLIIVTFRNDNDGVYPPDACSAQSHLYSACCCWHSTYSRGFPEYRYHCYCRTDVGPNWTEPN